ncbi:hypothetical protein WJX73_001296 [Symbiochloris irregularis]|uniref:Uncharacterized protein n=1 Tax=Symbiochloris irregularis TaxID=706552 RepID=A0AAW1PMA8_9CHLO
MTAAPRSREDLGEIDELMATLQSITASKTDRHVMIPLEGGVGFRKGWLVQTDTCSVQLGDDHYIRGQTNISNSREASKPGSAKSSFEQTRA